ncbi:hypothetical protein BKA58DRAFT_147699 [Alternaria rosae]|uniref:uncharacterized protein n=1 Tax=Alternaria rosae TaxID=1187941 RepID=UPI001E8D943A|nr:uncharacterized protein BKA58DRAFT_147699 [Alternaria rosae]KAH6872526.1 hypothetical protein BKA58DRAFT_147699 [Alternaria rosae]
MIVCSLQGLFRAADRDETSTTRQSGHLAAVSSRPPFREWCCGQCSCVAARDCDVFAGRANRCVAWGWALAPRGSKSPFSRARNAKLSDYSRDVILGTKANRFSLTSEIYRLPIWERLAAAACQCYRGARKWPGLSDTDHMHWG